MFEILNGKILVIALLALVAYGLFSGLASGIENLGTGIEVGFTQSLSEASNPSTR